MCPLCISSMALTVAGATSTGALSTLVVRRFAHIGKKPKTHQPEETLRHDNEPARAPEHSLAR
jgi:hypothetical protein